MRNLQRHCKEKWAKSDSDTIILMNLLQSLKTSPAIPSDHQPDDMPTKNEDDPIDVDQWYTSSGFPQASSSQSGMQLEHLPPFSGNIINELTERVDVGDNIGSNSLPTLTPGPIVRQPRHINSNFMATEDLLHLSQEYFHVKVEKHPLSVNVRLHGMVPESDQLALWHNRQFWTKIKNGIWFLKMGSHHLARPELTEAFQMIPLICEEQPFALLKDIHANASPLATRVFPTLRINLLQAFRKHAVTKLGLDHVFSRICRILCTEEGSDELSMAALQAMLNESREALQPDHPELFNLQRSIIQFYRRNKEFSRAEGLSRSLIESSKNLDIFKKNVNNVNVRLALSELVHVFNDQNRYDEALDIAQDVLHRGQLDQGHGFPDKKSVYAMEDVAEIYDKLNRIDDCIYWLQRASVAECIDHRSMVHILEKLDAMQKKKLRQIVHTDMP